MTALRCLFALAFMFFLTMYVRQSGAGYQSTMKFNKKSASHLQLSMSSAVKAQICRLKCRKQGDVVLRNYPPVCSFQVLIHLGHACLTFFLPHAHYQWAALGFASIDCCSHPIRCVWLRVSSLLRRVFSRCVEASHQKTTPKTCADRYGTARCLQLGAIFLTHV